MALTQKQVKSGGSKKALLRDVSSDEDEPSNPLTSASSIDPERPWLKDFHCYLDAIHDLPDTMDIVQWWEVSGSLIVQSFSSIGYSFMLPDIPSGLGLQRITFQSWPPQFQVKGLFLLVVLPSTSIGIA